MAAGGILKSAIRTGLRNQSVIVLLVCGLALSIYSGYTTLQGMTSFTAAGDRFSAMALLATIGIQGVMLVSAWIIGDRLKFWGASGAWLANFAFIVMFLATMACSVFFSYDSIFSSAADARYRTAFANIESQTAVTQILNELPGQIDNQLAKAGDDLKTGQPWQSLQENIQKLVALQAQLIGQLRDAEESRNARTAERQRKRNLAREQVESRIDAIRIERSRLAVRITTYERAIAEQKQRITAAQSEYQSLEASYRKAEADVVREALGVAGAGLSGKAGCGPECRKKRRISNELQASSLAALRRLDTAKQRELDQHQQLAEHKTKLARLDRRLAAAGETTPAPAAARAPESDAAPAAVTDQSILIEQLKTFNTNPTSATLAPLLDSCASVQSAIRQVHGRFAQRSACSAAGLDDKLLRVARLTSAKAAFADNCRAQQAAVQSKPFREAIAFGADCLRRSGLSFAAMAPYQLRLNTLLRESTAHAHQFYQSWKALAVGDTLALFALAVAVGIDTLTFFTGIFGAQTTFSPMDRVRLADVSQMLANVPLAHKYMMLAAVKPERPRESGGFSSARADAYVGSVAEADLDRPGVRRIIQIAMGRQARRDEPLIRHMHGNYYIHGVLRDELEYRIGRESADGDAVAIHDLQTAAGGRDLSEEHQTAATPLAQDAPLKLIRGSIAAGADHKK